ncbi:MAG: biotin transporter BioY [Beijerinckiaceae bacterium]|nr:biotin transporter BioY [Beijerinckiaceae bacterium]
MQTRTLVRASLFAALIALLGLVPRIDVPVAAGVPITAQTLGVMLAGLVLGARIGAMSVLLFLFVVALGAPLLSGGRGGIGVFFGPTAGYLVGWVFGAAAVGFLMEQLPIGAVFLRALLACVIGGVIIIYLFGIPYLAFAARLTLDKAFLAGLVFLPGDLLKAVAAALVARSYFLARTPLK